MLKTKHINLLRRLSLVLVILIGIVISMKSIKEPDLWWQLRAGEWMLEHQKVTTKDIFSYSYEGVEWINVKWGYEILQAFVAKIGSPAFLPFLQVVITILLLIVLIKTISFIGRYLINETYRPAMGAAIALMIGLWIMEFRMTGRPEAVSHLMTAAFVLLFIQHRFQPSKWIFMIVPLQALWTNFHEAYGMGIILTIVFTSAAWIEYWLVKKHSKWYSHPSANPSLKLINIAAILCIIAICINPRRYILLLHPLEIFSQLGENKYTIELYSFTSTEFWNYRSVATLILFVLTFKFLSKKLIRQQKLNPSWWQKCISNIGLGYTLFLLATLYLSLSAYRNIPFCVIALTPIIAVAIDKWFAQKKEGILLKYYTVVLFTGILFYVAVVSGRYYKIFNPRNHFGLEINVEKTPYGAAQFIQEQNIKGRAFTDFLSSSYLLWHLQPEFKTYIDLRDLDIYPAVFFKNNFLIYQFPEKIFPLADEDMHFDYIVLLNNLIFQSLHRYLLQTENFELVHADILSSVYLRKNDNNQPIIEQYGFQQGTRDVFHKFNPISLPAIPKIATRIFNPFHHFRDYTDINYAQFRFLYYQYIGQPPPQ